MTSEIDFAPVGEHVRRFSLSLRGPAYRWLTVPVGLWLVTRVIVALGFYLSAVMSHHPVDRSQNLLTHFLTTWDSNFYLGIARTGYIYSPFQQTSIAFFPVYPLSIRLVSDLTGDPILGGLIVSHLALLGALILLYRLAELEFHDAGMATRTLVYLLAFPTSLFFSMVYTESLFLLLAVGTIYFARCRQWGWASGLCLLCVGTRVNGLAAWLFLVVEWLAAAGWSPSRSFTRAAWRSLWHTTRADFPSLLLVGLAPLSLVSFMVYQQRYFGDALAFVHVQRAWGRTYEGIGKVIGDGLLGLSRGDFLAGQVNFLTLINLSALIFATLLTVWVWRRLGTSYGLFLLAAILIPAISGLDSLTRYVAVMFPLFFALAWWGRRPLADRAILFGLAMLLGIFLTIFVSNIFIA